MGNETKIVKCERCGKEIVAKKSGRKKRFCKDCVRAKQREYARAHYKSGSLSAFRSKDRTQERLAKDRYNKCLETMRANKKKYMEEMKVDESVSTHVNGDGSRTIWRGCRCGSGGRSENYL